MMVRRVGRLVFNYPCPRKLREVVKLSLLERESSDKIAGIWQAYHSERERNVAFAWPTAKYEQLRANSQKARLFVYPVFRSGGHFMLLSQYQEQSFLFTYLEEFKQKGPNAEPYFVLTCFEELAKSKGLVLIRGDRINRRLSEGQAKSVSQSLLKFSLDPDLFQTYVWPFNNSPEQFDYEKYMALYKP